MLNHGYFFSKIELPIPPLWFMLVRTEGLVFPLSCFETFFQLSSLNVLENTGIREPLFNKSYLNRSHKFCYCISFLIYFWRRAKVYNVNISQGKHIYHSKNLVFISFLWIIFGSNARDGHLCSNFMTFWKSIWSLLVKMCLST